MWERSITKALADGDEANTTTAQPITMADRRGWSRNVLALLVGGTSSAADLLPGVPRMKKGKD